MPILPLKTASKCCTYWDPRLILAQAATSTIPYPQLSASEIVDNSLYMGCKIKSLSHANLMFWYSTNQNALKFRYVYSRAFIKTDQIFGWESGYCITTMHLPTQHFWKGNFGKEKTNQISWQYWTRLSERHYKECFHARQRHWNACIKLEGKYFEGVHNH